MINKEDNDMMQYYKCLISGEIYGYDCPTQDELITDNLIKLTKKELELLEQSQNPPQDTKEEANNKKEYLLSVASDVIKPLEYAVKLNVATDAEKELLTQWQLYIVLVNRVDTSLAPDIDWPEQPQ